jgi:hypothetical protein
MRKKKAIPKSSRGSRIDRRVRKSASRKTGSTRQDHPKDRLVVGPPTLKIIDVQDFCRHIEWILDVKLDSQLTALAKDDLIGIWSSNKRKAIQVIQFCVAMIRDLDKKQKHMRDQYREFNQPKLVPFFQSINTPFINRCLKLYFRANPPIATGNPPLTKEIADSSLELINLYNAICLNSRTSSTLKETEKQAWRKLLSPVWHEMSSDEKAFYVDSPFVWAKIQYNSPHMSAKKKTSIKRKILALPPNVKQFYSDTMNAVSRRRSQNSNNSQVRGLKSTQVDDNANSQVKEKSDIKNLQNNIKGASIQDNGADLQLQLELEQDAAQQQMYSELLKSYDEVRTPSTRNF